MKQTFWSQFWASMRRAYGGLVIVLGIPISFLLWYVKPNQNVPLSTVLPLGFVCIGIIFTLSHMSYVVWQNRRKPFPRVIHSRQPTSVWKDYDFLCLLEPSDLFSQGYFVSIYIKDEDGFEVLIGLGSVLNIQDDERILIGMSVAAEGYDDVIKAIANNDKKRLEQLIIKPNIPQDYLSRILPGGNNV